MRRIEGPGAAGTIDAIDSIPQNPFAHGRARRQCGGDEGRGPAEDLELPDHLASGQRELIVGLAERNHSEHGDGLLGLVLSGSAARGMATERSDLDMYVVPTDDAARERRTHRSAAVDEIPVALSELEKVPLFGSPGWWFRWSFAWAPTLLDRTGDRIAEAVRARRP